MLTLRLVLSLLVALFGFVHFVKADVFNGQGTWYNVTEGGAPTACGQMHTNEEYIGALQAAYFNSYPGGNPDNPNTNPICQQKLKATYQGKSVVVQVADKCGGCPGTYDVDFSPIAFKVLADQGIGRMDIQWEYTTLPLGPVSADGDPPTRRSKILGRRRVIDPVPARLFRRSSHADQPTPGDKPAIRLHRRHLTQAERKDLLARESEVAGS